jgi:iron complex outermembrane recepter protein
MVLKNLAAVAAIIVATPVSAQDIHRYDIAAQDLSAALRAFAVISGREVVADSEVIRDEVSRPVSGEMTAEAAIRRLIDGTALRVEIIAGSFVVRSIANEPSIRAYNDAERPEASDIVVTGTRVRGAPVSSPVIRLGRDALRESGVSSLGDAIRTLPQSFGGGQNIGVGLNVPSENGANVGGGSSANLRGLGSDATLTLLNGHRLPYGAARQSVDVSAIPFIAVDRLEIVADGSSALYGSDAVAGVVNIILRRDFDVLEASAQRGRSTDGGNSQQLYGVIGGRKWREGGAFVAYEFNHTTPILAEDRRYAASRTPGLTLFPGLTKHNVATSAHQRLGSRLELSIDGMFNDRRSGLSYALNAAGDPNISRGFQSTVAQSFAVAPRAVIDLATDWRLSLLATFGQDRVEYEAANIIGTTTVSASKGCYCNTGYSAEVGADGTAFVLNGEPVRLALGVGYRRNDYDSFRGAGDLQNIDQQQRIWFGYGEVSAPLIAPEHQNPLANKVVVSAAARYEHYADIGGVLTPKLGLIYAPSSGLDLKASWGRSFRAPTFSQQYQFQQGIALPAIALGGSGFAANATAVALIGGNPDLKPETATSLSVSAAWRPEIVRGLKVEIGYFETRYINRIVNPVTVTGQALSDAVYREYVILSPSPAQVQAAVAAADLFINGTGSTFDPSRVVAIVNSLNVNAGRQTIQGVDALLEYRAPIGDGEVSLSANASYLDSQRRLTPTSGTQQLAGTLFNPPHFRARGTIGWSNRDLTAAATISRIGGVDDLRAISAIAIAGMTTLDFNFQYRPTARGVFAGTEISLALLNLLNARPSPIRTTFFTDTPYDSTNYSPVGRYVSVGVRKRW